MLLVTLKEKKLLERFTKKKFKKTNQKEFRVKKVIQRKGDKLYATYIPPNRIYFFNFL